MEVVVFGLGRWALGFGEQTINLHQQEARFEPKAQDPTPGSADLCLLTETPVEEVIPTSENAAPRCSNYQ